MSQAYPLEYGTMAADAPAIERQAFIRRTYLHVAGAVGVFAGLCVLLQVIVPPETMQVLFANRFGWLAVLLLFMGGQFLAVRLVGPDKPANVQYLGLGLFVLLEALVFWPLLWIANNLYPPGAGEMGIVAQAALLTGTLAGGLTMAAFFTGTDYSFLRPVISIGCWVALGIIIIAIIGGFNLGIFFPLAMVGLMSAVILYQTSQVMYHYTTNQYVGAALAIFSAIATMFWYMLQLLMASRR